MSEQHSADRIRAAIEAETLRSVPLTTDNLAAAVCEALADVVVPEIVAEDWRYSSPQRSEILTIAADLRGEVRNG